MNVWLKRQNGWHLRPGWCVDVDDCCGSAAVLVAKLIWRVIDPVLPVIYIVVIIMGFLMIFGRNPFNKLTTVEAPILRNPFATAWRSRLTARSDDLALYRAIDLKRFLLGAGSFAELGSGLAYFSFRFGIRLAARRAAIPGCTVPAPFHWLDNTQLWHIDTRQRAILLVGIGFIGICHDLLPLII